MADKTHADLRLDIINAKTPEEKDAAIKAHNDFSASHMGRSIGARTPSPTHLRVLDEKPEIGVVIEGLSEEENKAAIEPEKTQITNTEGENA